MRKAFLMRLAGTDVIATYQGRVIVATSDRELDLGPSARTLDLDNLPQVTVTNWIKEQVNGSER